MLSIFQWWIVYFITKREPNCSDHSLFKSIINGLDAFFLCHYNSYIGMRFNYCSFFVKFTLSSIAIVIIYHFVNEKHLKSQCHGIIFICFKKSWLNCVLKSSYFVKFTTWQEQQTNENWKFSNSRIWTGHHTIPTL